MEKYIKAETICNFIDECLAHEDKITDIEKATLCAIKSFIERTPSADVRPVVYGEWRKIYMSSPSSFVGTCSACGQSNDIPHPLLANFCPNCGADMRKEKKYGDCD